MDLAKTRGGPRRGRCCREIDRVSFFRQSLVPPLPNRYLRSPSHRFVGGNRPMPSFPRVPSLVFALALSPPLAVAAQEPVVEEVEVQEARETAPAPAPAPSTPPDASWAPDRPEPGSVEKIREYTTAPEFLPESVAYVPDSDTGPSAPQVPRRPAGGPGGPGGGRARAP